MAPAVLLCQGFGEFKRGPTETGNENIHFFKCLFGISWWPHGSESRWLFLGVLFGADWEVSPRRGW
ncbi:hypothetical protein EBX31_04690, partial [bacterium]|nr:hypothetical protein [bacterium]